MSAGCCWNCRTLYAMATFLPPSGCQEMLRGTVTHAIPCGAYCNILTLSRSSLACMDL
jgi:hypothetical protein